MTDHRLFGRLETERHAMLEVLERFASGERSPELAGQLQRQVRFFCEAIKVALLPVALEAVPEISSEAATLKGQCETLDSYTNAFVDQCLTTRPITAQLELIEAMVVTLFNTLETEIVSRLFQQLDPAAQIAIARRYADAVARAERAFAHQRPSRTRRSVDPLGRFHAHSPLIVGQSAQQDSA